MYLIRSSECNLRRLHAECLALCLYVESDSFDLRLLNIVIQVELKSLIFYF
jgi:hypothetical protein